MENQTQRPTKAKRKLSNISFEHEGAHVALVNKDQGGGANGHNYALVMKSAKFSEDFIAKAAKVRITMDIEEFLVKFYGMWYEDAEVLARALGFDTAEEDMSEEEMNQSYEDYIQSKVDAIEVFKALHEAESIPTVLSTLDEDQYLAMLKSQQMLEKAFKKIEKESKTIASAKKAVVEEAPQENASVGDNVEAPTSVIKKKESETMTQEVKTVEQEITVEMVEKSALESVQKALDDQKVALAKAMETIAQFEAEKKEAIAKQRLADVKAAVKDEANAEIIFKAVKEAAEEDFKAVVKALAAITTATEQSDLFVEKGAAVEEQAPVNSSALEKLLKAKFQGK